MLINSATWVLLTHFTHEETEKLNNLPNQEELELECGLFYRFPNGSSNVSLNATRNSVLPKAVNSILIEFPLCLNEISWNSALWLDFCLLRSERTGLILHMETLEPSEDVSYASLFKSSSLPSSLVAEMVTNLSAMWETWIWPLGQKDPLEEGMAPQSSILTWRIPWTEEPGRLHTDFGVAKSQTGLRLTLSLFSTSF